MYKKVLSKPRWSPFLKLSAPAYTVKPVIVGYPHLVHSACLITTHLDDKIIIKDIPLLSSVVPVVDSARNLGVNIDSQLSMDVHVAAVCRSGYYQLRQLRPLTRSLSAAAAETVVHAFIASRLDYCNALLYGVSDRLMCRLQSVQIAAARLVTGARRCDNYTVCPCNSAYCSRSLSSSFNV